MKIDTSFKTVTEAIQTIELTDADIIPSIFERIKKELPEGVAIGDARMYINIPGGGDWSNMELEVSKNHPLIVEVRYINISEI
jgi:hypothetical protein